VVPAACRVSRACKMSALGWPAELLFVLLKLARVQRFGFHPKVDLDVLVRRGNADVAEPAANDVPTRPELKQVASTSCGGTCEASRRKPSRLGIVLTALVASALNDVGDAGAAEWLTIAIEEQGGRSWLGVAPRSSIWLAQKGTRAVQSGQVAIWRPLPSNSTHCGPRTSLPRSLPSPSASFP